MCNLHCIQCTEVRQKKIINSMFQAFNAAKSCFLPPEEKKELIKKLKIVHGLDDQGRKKAVTSTNERSNINAINDGWLFCYSLILFVNYLISEY